MKHYKTLLLLFSLAVLSTPPLVGSESPSSLEENPSFPLLKTTPLSWQEQPETVETGEVPVAASPLLQMEDAHVLETPVALAGEPIEDIVASPTEAAVSAFIKSQGLDFRTKGYQKFGVLEAEPCMGLSIDGGGMRGLMPALWLEALEELLDENEDTTYNKKSDSLYQIFEYVGGPSIGGILALGVADGIPSTTLVSLFKEHGPTIFPSSKKSWVRSLDILNVLNLVTPRYAADSLESLLHDYFGEKTLREAKTNILVTACTAQGYPWIFKKGKAEGAPDYLLREVARCTSAAPTFFPAYRPSLIGREDEIQPFLVDGGLWINNPSPLIAASLVKEHLKGFDPEKIHILSLGTGESHARAIPEHAGLIHGKTILDALMSSHSRGNHETMVQFFEDNYYRINPPLKKPIGLDDTSSKGLRCLEAAANQEGCKKELNRFVEATGTLIRKKLEGEGS
jgi:patatin-like phospholipase/acyl hydrolase